MKKTWLFVTPLSLDAIGGVARVVNALAAEMHQVSLNDVDWKPMVFVLDWQALYPVSEIRNGVSCVRCRVPPPDMITGGKQAALKPLYALQYLLLKRFLRRHNVGVVNVHYVTPMSFALIKVARQLGIKVIASFHGADLAEIESASTAPTFWPEYLDMCDVLVGCSNNYAERLRRSITSINADLAKKVTAVANGIDINAMALADKGAVWPEHFIQQSLVVSVGTFEHKKGHDTLIRAFAQVASELQDTHLVIVGRDGPEYQALELLVESLGLAGRVTLLKNCPYPKVLALYCLATLYVSASRVEPFGLVMAEAGLASLPVVATKTDGATELLAHRQTGWLVDIDDVLSLSKAIVYLLNDNDNGGRGELAESLQRSVTRSLSWRKALDAYLALA
ncbi:MAG: hypothetical protein CMF25_02970 [Kangiellaceae bacterium]|nr:hypothetical protein [Kangiellaceae bacterium]|tara:strand:+ start:1273 stop:2451 length:1179 start_codon:yes stop_codon:yes gene_type:complete